MCLQYKGSWASKNFLFNEIFIKSCNYTALLHYHVCLHILSWKDFIVNLFSCLVHVSYETYSYENAQTTESNLHASDNSSINVVMFHQLVK